MRFILLWVVSASLIAACGNQGTDVGNAISDPVSAELQLISDSSAAPTALSTGQATLTQAILYVKALSLRPKSDCDASTPDVKRWYRAAKSIQFDLLSADPVSVSIVAQKSDPLCEIRIILAPNNSGSQQGKSLSIVGTTGGGRAFQIQSTQKHALILKRANDFSLTADAALLEAVIYRGEVISHLNLDQLPGTGQVNISPESTPALFRLFMLELHKALRGYRFQRDGNNQVIRPRTDEVGIGDETLRDPEANEI